MPSHVLGPDTSAAYADLVTRLSTLVTDHLATSDRPSTGATVAELRPQVDAVDLDRPAGDVGVALEEVRDLYLKDAVWFAHPDYMAHLNCPVDVAAAAAETLLGALSTSMDTWDQSYGATLIEERLIRWLADRIGLGEGSDGVFTPGGTTSNLQALLCARGAALDAGARLADLRIIATDQAHFSVITAARTLGLGDDAVVTVATDDRHALDPLDLRRVLLDVRAKGATPMAVVATAGTTDLGLIDPLRPIAEVCAELGTWLHVDAAYGGGLVLSQRYRDLLDGLELADSVTVDFHKTFFAPVSASAVLLADARELRHVTHHADYLNPRTSVVPNLVDKSMQTTRRFDALKVWMSLRVTGADTLGQSLDTCLDLARGMAREVAADPDLELGGEPVLSTVLFRWHPAGLTDAVADDLVARIRQTLLDDGQVMLASTKIDGRPWLKVTLLNPAADPARLRAILDLVAATGRALLGEVLSDADWLAAQAPALTAVTR